MGRKDIYKVNLNEPTEPKNIGITVNTQGDELGFIVDASGQWGYFSSDISGKDVFIVTAWMIVLPVRQRYISVC